MMRGSLFICGFVLLFLRQQGAIAARGESETVHTYALYMSKYVRPGVPAEIVARIFQAENPVKITATLSSGDFTSLVTETIAEGEEKTLKFSSIPMSYEGNTGFNITVTGTDSETGEELFMNKTGKGDITFEKKFVSIFIQTDKAIYEPSHTIKFRAIVTTPDLLPYNGKVTYKLIDPNKNVILLKKNVDLSHGVAGSQYTLGRYSTTGNWKISYTVYGYEETLNVLVKEYKLPKFKVEFELDQKYLTPNVTGLSGKFWAKYTFGEFVKGMARLEVSSARYRDFLKLPTKVLRKYQVLDGKTKFSIPIDEILNAIEWRGLRKTVNLDIMASITEKNTGETRTESTKIVLYKERIKVDIIARPPHFKPGLPYKAYIRVTEPDGTLLSAEERSTTKLNVSVTYRDERYKRDIYSLDIDDDGIVVLDITLDNVKDRTVYFLARIGELPGRYNYDWTASRFISPSDAFLQISSPKSSYSVNEDLNFDVYTTERAKLYNLVVIARGKFVLKTTLTNAEHEKGEYSYKFSYGFTVNSEMSPSLHLIVSFTKEDGEIVADGRRFSVSTALANQVTISTSTNSTKVGTNVQITVHTAPDSFVGLRAIDQSVLLLRQGNDITQERIFNDLSKYGTTSSYSYGRYWYYWTYWMDAEDVSQVFDESGILVMTDALVYSARRYFPNYYSYYDYDIGHRSLSGGSSGVQRIIGGTAYTETFRSGASKGPKQQEVTVVTRTDFPESWIWADGDTGSNGSTTFTYETPDTITTWELSSFGVSSSKGLGATKRNSQIKVFRDFFVTLDLPPSMIRGEILNMRTTVFNYRDYDVQAKVELRKSTWFTLVIVGKDKIAAGPIRNVLIPRKDSITVVFPIKLKKAGDAKIQVKAVTDYDGDAVERSLLVKPEGMNQLVSRNLLIDRQGYAPTTEETMEVDYPEDVVPGSAWARFSVSGDILGNSLNNLGSLLRMPSGCGEQTMVSFAPDIYVTLYLQRAGKLTKELAQKSDSHIRHGYQNILRYQHEDGSFSAFGRSDNSGSTWLTAFVVKCLIAATKLSDELIETEKITKAVKFILMKQSKDGIFRESGRVISRNIQGGVESEETMAAYIIIALHEENFFSDKSTFVMNGTKKAQAYLEGRVEEVNDMYTLAVMGYALTLVDSPLAGKVMNKIESRGRTKGNKRYWEERVIGATPCVGWHCRYYREEQSASSVEITSYVLLTYVKMDRRSEIMPITRWLVSQRGAFGGYYSTQDTVMGIQALSAVAGLFANRNLDLSITVNHDAQRHPIANFKVKPENSIVLQSVELPNARGDVSIKVEGEGVADVQLLVSYNFPYGPRKDEPFNLGVTMEEGEEEGIVNLRVCARINEKRKEVFNKTGMFVITVDLASGFTVDENAARDASYGARLVELVGEEVTGYFYSLVKGRKVCLDLTMTRYAKVSGVKPKVIKAFDYYNPGRISLREYQLKKTAGVCTTCGPDCVGCPGISQYDASLYLVNFNSTNKITEQIAEPRRAEDGSKLLNFYCEDFPCPDFSDGLYYDPSSQVAEIMETHHPEVTRPCSVSGVVESSRKFPGPPGTYINGTIQSIQCANTRDFRDALNSLEGFAIAAMFYFTEKVPNNHTFLTMGVKGVEQPLLEFRRTTRGFHHVLRIHGYEFTSTFDHWRIINGLAVNRWTHIALLYSGGPFPVLYINGGKIDADKNARWISEIVTEVKGEVTLTIGKTNDDDKSGIVGVVSNLDFWKTPLDGMDILDHFEYHLDAMLEKDPLLSEAQAQHAIPEVLWPCLESFPYPRASVLKVGINEEPILCNGQGYH